MDQLIRKTWDNSLQELNRILRKIFVKLFNLEEDLQNLTNTVNALPTTYSLPTGSSTWTEVTLNFGSTPVYDAVFTVVDASVVSGSKIIIVPCGKAATGRTADDWQWDGLILAATPGAGVFTVYCTAHPGPIVGNRLVQYQVA
jgi:hypothetical protein